MLLHLWVYKISLCHCAKYQAVIILLVFSKAECFLCKFIEQYDSEKQMETLPSKDHWVSCLQWNNREDNKEQKIAIRIGMEEKYQNSEKINKREPLKKQ